MGRAYATTSGVGADLGNYDIVCPQEPFLKRRVIVGMPKGKPIVRRPAEATVAIVMTDYTIEFREVIAVRDAAGIL